MKWISKVLVLFFVGGIIYCFIELLFRGYTHWTMGILGGLCFILIGLLNEIYTWDMSLTLQMGISAIVITVLEFIFGLVLNIGLNLNIWNYSNMPLNLFGQVCLPFTVIWFFLSFVAILVDDWIRFFYFKEEFPHYKIL